MLSPFLPSRLHCLFLFHASPIAFIQLISPCMYSSTVSMAKHFTVYLSLPCHALLSTQPSSALITCPYHVTRFSSTFIANSTALVVPLLPSFLALTILVTPLTHFSYLVHFPFTLALNVRSHNTLDISLSPSCLYPMINLCI